MTALPCGSLPLWQIGPVVRASHLAEREIMVTVPSDRTGDKVIRLSSYDSNRGHPGDATSPFNRSDAKQRGSHQDEKSLTQGASDKGRQPPPPSRFARLFACYGKPIATQSSAMRIGGHQTGYGKRPLPGPRMPSHRPSIHRNSRAGWPPSWINRSRTMTARRPCRRSMTCLTPRTSREDRVVHTELRHAERTT